MNNVALMAACFAESARSDDIYDFVPEPIIGNVSMNQEEAKQCISDILKAQQPRAPAKPVLPDLGSVSIEELSRMSVMELNEKMTAGLNFTNISLAAFLSESVLQCFFLLSVWVCNILAKENYHKSCS